MMGTKRLIMDSILDSDKEDYVFNPYPNQSEMFAIRLKDVK